VEAIEPAFVFPGRGADEDAFSSKFGGFDFDFLAIERHAEK